MKVSAENFKVIPLKKALIFYCILIGCALLSYQILKLNISQNHFVWDLLVILFFILMACIGIASLFYGFKIVKCMQSPPPNTWVLSNWRVISGKKAYWSGWVIVFCGAFVSFAFIFQLIVYIKYFV